MTRTYLRTYTPEFRAEAVKVVLGQGLSLEATAQRLSLPKGTLANWVKAARYRPMTPTSPPGSRSVAELEDEIAKLRRKLAVERMEKEILKKRRRTLLKSRCPVRATEDDRPDYPIALLCRVFKVSRSGFYAWLNRKPSRRQQTDERLKVAIKAAHQQSRETYGVRRMQPELEAQGFAGGRNRIGRLRKELGLRCKQKRKFKATTNSCHDFPVAPNLLEQRFEPTVLNQQWLVGSAMLKGAVELVQLLR